MLYLHFHCKTRQDRQFIFALVPEIFSTCPIQASTNRFPVSEGGIYKLWSSSLFMCLFSCWFPSLQIPYFPQCSLKCGMKMGPKHVSILSIQYFFVCQQLQEEIWGTCSLGRNSFTYKKGQFAYARPSFQQDDDDKFM